MAQKYIYTYLAGAAIVSINMFQLFNHDQWVISFSVLQQLRQKELAEITIQNCPLHY